jgi:hypothetical protein
MNANNYKRLLVPFSVAVAALAVMTAAPLPAYAGDVITADNWTEKAGFAPDLTTTPIKPGQVIWKGNYKSVAALLPAGLQKMVSKYELKMKLRKYEKIHPSLGYIKATNKYRGTAKIINNGNDFRKIGLKGYVAGLPFPNPKNGLEAAWDFIYNYNGDDGDLYYDVLWVSAGSGIENKETWRWAYLMRTIHRTDIAPIPAIEDFKKKRIQYASITYALAPFDKKGFGAVYTRSLDPLDMQGHIYVPAMRRVLRNAFGTRGDTWNATDTLYEDVRGYLGYPEWMNWKLIGKKTVLMPMHAGLAATKKYQRNFETEKWPHWNPKAEWEPRPMYVVEVTPKMSDYPYGKMYAYIDAEAFTMPYKEAYDKKGELWKVILTPWEKSADMNSLPATANGSLTLDFQSEHATITNIFKSKVNTGLDPGMFTINSLRKRGR